MLQKIILQCKYSGEQRANYNWGSLFHGVLLKLLPDEMVELLHQSQLRPFSQYILPRPGKQMVWTIGLWDSEISNSIVQAVMPMSQVELKHKDMFLDVMGIQRISQSEEEYFSRFFTVGIPCRRYEIEFLTPCTHKQDGAYVLFPSPELIINSVSKRYSAFMHDVSLDDVQAMQQVAQHMRIVRYSLHSAVYYLERTKITGYMGKITVVINGPEQLARLAGALLFFGEYSGVGIKSALGMGGVSIKKIV